MARFLFYLMVSLLTFSAGVFLVPSGMLPDIPALPPVPDIVESGNLGHPDTSFTAAAPRIFPGISRKGEFAAVGLFVSDGDRVSERLFENLSGKPLTIELKLGEDIDGRIIRLYPFSNDRREFRVEEQFETSMTINEEGPHRDLTNWKHYTSEWRELHDRNGLDFRSLALTEEEMSRFPDVTPREIYEKVLHDEGKRWADIAKTCRKTGDGACNVSVSRISFRILAKENGRWTVIHRIDIFPPMGC